MKLADYGEFAERKTWNVHSRSECIRCHNSWIGGTLAFTLPQLHRTPVDTHGATAQAGLSQPMNQLEWYREIGLLTGAELEDGNGMVSAFDTTADLNSRARSYLAANCAHCHQKGAGGTATIDLRFEANLGETKTVGAAPAQGLFQIPDASIVSAGAPWKSVLLYRAACSGRGRMPHIGSELVDDAGVQLLRKWIASLSGDAVPEAPVASLKSTEAAIELVAALDRGEIPTAERDAMLTQARDTSPEIHNLLARFQPWEYRQQLNRSLIPRPCCR